MRAPSASPTARAPSAVARLCRRAAMIAAGLGLVVLLFVALDLLALEYAYLAAYAVLQYVAIATAWNILGGYAGYVNFGSAAFFAIGCYATIFTNQAFDFPLLASIPVAALAAGLVGLGTGYLTLRLRGVFFSIATLALAVVLQTFVVNWDYVGGSRGVYMLRPEAVPMFGTYVQFLFAVMLALAIGSVLVARAIERSWLGQGLAAIREDETAAECCGVATLRLKLIATVVSGALMGMAGAPFPYFVTYVDPATAFNLSIGVNAVAMPLVGGTTTWAGPVIGALLLGSVQQIITVTVSGQLNLMIVGVLLVVFIVLAPNGITGVLSSLRKAARK
jgi:branched-chain amino acid transport system permease protein